MAGTLLREAYKLKRVYGSGIVEKKGKTPERKEYDRLMGELKKNATDKKGS